MGGLNVDSVSLKSILNLIGSQWRGWSKGVAWTNGRDLVTTWARDFWTRCSHILRHYARQNCSNLACLSPVIITIKNLYSALSLPGNRRCFTFKIYSGSLGKSESKQVGLEVPLKSCVWVCLLEIIGQGTPEDRRRCGDSSASVSYQVGTGNRQNVLLGWS